MFKRLTGLPFALLVASLAVPLCAQAQTADDLLPVEQAFKLSARVETAERIALHWDIAKDYYLYRSRIKAKTTQAGLALDAIALPDGHKKHDEFLGDVETYHDRVDATLPYTLTDAAAKTLTLTVTVQGCHETDPKICYPPNPTTLTLDVPAGPAATTAAATSADAASAPVSALAQKLAAADAGSANTDRTPLPPEQAFVFEAIAQSPTEILARWTMPKGYYLYRDKSSVTVAGASATTLGAPQWPTGVSHNDEHFGAVTVYFDQVEVPLPLLRTNGSAETLTLHAEYQGCQDDGICYPVMTRDVAVELPVASAEQLARAGGIAAEAAPTTAGSAGAKNPARGIAAEGAPTAAGSVGAKNPVGGIAAEAAPTTAGSVGAKNPVGGIAAEAAPTPAGSAGATAGSAGTASARGGQSEEQVLAANLSSNRLLALLSFFGFGLLLAFTPCVFPMVPILSGIIAGSGDNISTKRAFVLSVVYVLATCIVFTIAGVVAGLAGANLQAAFQKPWILCSFAAIFVLLSLSMFGFYELQLPASLQTKIAEISNQQKGGSLIGVAIMGLLSALIVGPCVAPPLAAAVLYISQTRDPVFGGLALFVLSLGMGAPLVVFGTAAGRWLPRAGAWMDAVKAVFGVVFLGLAIWMLARILDGTWIMLLSGALLIASAVYLGALDRLADGASGWRKLWKAFGVILLVLGAAELIGAAGGGRDVTQPLAGIAATSGASPSAATQTTFRVIKSSADLDRELAAASQSGKRVMLDFYADWCVSCKEMEKFTFSQAAVHDALAGFVLLKADVTANDDADQALLKRFGLFGPPATIFFAGVDELRGLRLIGFEKTDAFVARIARVGG